MRQFLKRFAVTGLVLLSVVTAGATLVPSQVGAAACSKSGHLLTLPYWYDGLQETKTVNGSDQCVIEISADNNFQDIWTIVLNVVNILMQLIGLVTVGFIIYGGGRYIVSQGNSTQLAAAKQTITRALVGLVIAVSSVFILNFIAHNILKRDVNSDTYQVSYITISQDIA